MDKLRDIFYKTNGDLTQELILEPSVLGLGQLPKRLMPQAAVNLICGYCSTGCSLTVHLRNREAVNLTPNRHHPVNLGEACPKGWEALTPLTAPDRAKTPLLKDRFGKLVAVDWDTALKIFVGRFKDIQRKYGAERVAFLSTGQFCTEEMALLGALAKFGMGMVHGDANTRQCMATAAVAYKQSFGFDAPPFTYKDFEESDVLVFVGANPCIAHPIMWQRVLMNRHHPKIVVIDPRKTETAMAATHHYTVAPKSDLSLFYGLARIFIANGWINQIFVERHTNGFSEFTDHVRQFPLELVSAATGLAIKEIEELADLIHCGQRVSFWWTMGVNQSHEGVRLAQAIINLALLTGNIGRPGTGANSITGQCNAMGSRLFSNTTSLLGGYDFLNPEHRHKIAEILKINPDCIPAQNSLSYDQILEQIPVHKIKGLWVIATNPAHSWINQHDFREVISQLDFLVVQDMYATTEMAQLADLVLPAAGWGEKEGTVINSERRLGLFRKVAAAPGVALADFYIFKLIAQYWGCAEMFTDWSSPEAVFQILKKISRQTPADISGIRDYQMIEESGGIQWPFPESMTAEALNLHQNSERRLFADGKFYHPDGKARFLFEDIRSVPEPPDKFYPFVLLTGRGTSVQWHTQTRTGKSAVLRKLYPKEAYVEINPQDAGRLKIEPGQWVHVSSLRGMVKAKAVVTPTVKPGELFMPMHYPETNRLTFAAFDPYSRQPSYKYCAANVTRLPHD